MNAPSEPEARKTLAGGEVRAANENHRNPPTPPTFLIHRALEGREKPTSTLRDRHG
jgi:hypothetical protein